MSLKSSTKKFLTFLNLIDANDSLSITNIIVIGVFFKLMLEPTPDMTVLVALVAALGSYAHKRHMQAKRNANKDQIETLIAKVDDLSTRQDAFAEAYNANAQVVQKAIDDHSDAIGRVQLQVNH